MSGRPPMWVMAASSRHTSSASLIGLGVLVAFGYATLVWRRRRADRRAAQAELSSERPPGDPNRFELHPGPGPRPGARPSRGPDPTSPSAPGHPRGPGVAGPAADRPGPGPPPDEPPSADP